MSVTAQKMKFSITDFFSKCDQIRNLLKKSVVENFIFCAVRIAGFPGLHFRKFELNTKICSTISVFSLNKTQITDTIYEVVNSKNSRVSTDLLNPFAPNAFFPHTLIIMILMIITIMIMVIMLNITENNYL